MSRAAVAGVTISRAYRIHTDGKLIGFVWKEPNGAWLNDRSTKRFFARREAIEALKRSTDKIGS